LQEQHVLELSTPSISTAVFTLTDVAEVSSVQPSIDENKDRVLSADELEARAVAKAQAAVEAARMAPGAVDGSVSREQFIGAGGSKEELDR
jgi:hypothetical protein